MTIEIESEIDRKAKPRIFRDGGRPHYKVKISLVSSDGDGLAEIQSVRYNLHKSFKEPTRTSYDKKTDFAIDIWTYGYFAITADVQFKDGNRQTISGEVKFNVAEAPKDVDDPFEQLRSAKQKLQSLRR